MPGHRAACGLLVLLTFLSCTAGLSETPSDAGHHGDVVRMLEGDLLGEDSGAKKPIAPLDLQAPVQKLLNSNLPDGPKKAKRPVAETKAMPGKASMLAAAQQEAAVFKARTARQMAKEDSEKATARASREKSRKAAQPQPPKRSAPSAEDPVKAKAFKMKARHVKSGHKHAELNRKKAEYEQNTMSRQEEVEADEAEAEPSSSEFDEHDPPAAMKRALGKSAKKLKKELLMKARVKATSSIMKRVMSPKMQAIAELPREKRTAVVAKMPTVERKRFARKMNVAKQAVRIAQMSGPDAKVARTQFVAKLSPKQKEAVSTGMKRAKKVYARVHKEVQKEAQKETPKQKEAEASPTKTEAPEEAGADQSSEKRRKKLGKSERSAKAEENRKKLTKVDSNEAAKKKSLDSKATDNEKGEKTNEAGKTTKKADKATNEKTAKENVEKAKAQVEEDKKKHKMAKAQTHELTMKAGNPDKNGDNDKNFQEHIGSLNIDAKERATKEGAGAHKHNDLGESSEPSVLEAGEHSAERALKHQLDAKATTMERTEKKRIRADETNIAMGETAMAEQGVEQEKAVIEVSADQALYNLPDGDSARKAGLKIMGDISTHRDERVGGVLNEKKSVASLKSDEAALLKASEAVSGAADGKTKRAEKGALIKVAHSLSTELKKERIEHNLVTSPEGSKPAEKQDTAKSDPAAKSENAPKDDHETTAKSDPAAKSENAPKDDHKTTEKKDTSKSNAEAKSDKAPNLEKPAEAKALETGSPLTAAGVLVTKMKNGKMQGDALKVLNHLREDVSEEKQGTLPRNEALKQLEEDGKKLLTDSKKVSDRSQKIQSKDEPALLSLVRVMANEHDKIKNMPEAQSTSKDQHKDHKGPGRPDGEQVIKNKPEAQSTPKPENKVQADLQAARAAVNGDQQKRAQIAKDELSKIGSIQSSLSADMHSASIYKADLAHELKDVKAEKNELQTEISFDAQNPPVAKTKTTSKSPDQAPAKVSTKTFGDELDKMEASGDSFVEKEVDDEEKAHVSQISDLEKDAAEFQNNVAKTAQMKVNMKRWRAKDAKIAAEEAKISQGIMDTTIDSPNLLQVGEGQNPGEESPANVDAGGEDPEYEAAVKGHPLKLMHDGLKKKVKSLKRSTGVVQKHLDCLDTPDAPSCDHKLLAASTVKKDKVAKANAVKKLKVAKAGLAKENHEKFVVKKAKALAKLNAAKESQTKKKMALVESLKALEKSEEARATEAKVEEVNADKTLKKRKDQDLKDETRLNEARFVANYVKKAKADVMNMKIVNPVAETIKKAKLEVEQAQIEHVKDIATSHEAARKSAQAASAFDLSADMSPNATEKASMALRFADVKFQQEVSMAHLSKVEIYDASSALTKNEQLYNALQGRMEAKRKKLAKLAEAKAKEEAPKKWDEKLKEMKQKVQEKAAQADEADAMASENEAANAPDTANEEQNAETAEKQKEEADAQAEKLAAEKNTIEQDQKDSVERNARKSESAEAKTKEVKEKGGEKSPEQSPEKNPEEVSPQSEKPDDASQEPIDSSDSKPSSAEEQVKEAAKEVAATGEKVPEGPNQTPAKH